MRAAICFFVAALAVLGAGCSGTPSSPQGHAADSTTRPLHASLDPHQVVSPTSNAKQPVPAELAHARGTFSGLLDTRQHTLSWHLSYAGLGTPQIVIADVHYGKTGQFGALLVRLCGPCRGTHPSGTVTVGSAAVSSMLAGATWVTVVTNTHPNGAIRGQIEAGTGSG
jgi:hypothetical protein